MSSRALLLALALACAGPAAAQEADAPHPGSHLPDPRVDVPLDGAELSEAFTNRTHRGSYSFRRPNIGTFAFEETTTDDGRTVHVHGDKTDLGTWRVRANVICFVYEDWDSRSGQHTACFNIYKRGNCFYHYNLPRGRVGAGRFTARSVHKGETPDCEPAMV